MSSKSIACHVRLRPSTETDGNVNPEGIIIQGNKISALNGQGDKRYHFNFDKCHDNDSTQEEVFRHIQPLLEQAWRGVNTTIFTYGVTGAGKTHTMQGTKEHPGQIPRTVDALFQRKDQLPERSVDIAMSYVEILKDEVYDLLGTRAEARKRDIRMSTGGHNVIADLICQPIASREEFELIYDAASKIRKTASTKLNSNSSRSHAILTLHIHKIDEAGKETHSKICLTDLAGSENNNLTGNDRERMRESSAINTSLTTLGKVVDALNVIAQRGGDATGIFIPYRESKLTRLLQDALGGDSQGLLICCLAPGEKFARDTINTLQFAKKSNSVENRLGDRSRDSRRLSHVPQPLAGHTDLNSRNTRAFSNPSVGVRQSLGRPALAAVSANVRHVKNQSTATVQGGLGKKRTQGELSLHLTEEQLEKRIQKIVTQEMANARGRESGTAVQEPLPIIPSTERYGNLTGCEEKTFLSPEEKDARAKVIVKHARRLHKEEDYVGALRLYSKAHEYVPNNQKLATRITELQLAIEGILPPPCLSSQSPHIPSVSNKLLKRLRTTEGSASLAELLYESDHEATMTSNKRQKGEVCSESEHIQLLLQ
ncbi:uncharacterized protein L203_100429 [Cryptococcus depauperatus CBS 7841]|uniref:Kinesin motor domain-containing protein n=1 Tax=Cryptococcus depauperatus CBS 7841 TaxID=1295531 RepID=A0AAJ8JN25_9TREE